MREREGNLLVEPRSHGSGSEVLQVGSSQSKASLLCWSFAGGSLRERVDPRGGFRQPVSYVRRVFLELNRVIILILKTNLCIKPDVVKLEQEFFVVNFPQLLM